jgi:hypothetical protein
MVRFWLAETVNVPLEVSPEVAVMSPEIVGVAVQDVPVTVRFPPRVVRPVPRREKVGLEVTFPRVKAVVLASPATIVDPRRVRVPGVVAEPIVLIEEAPLPKVLVRDDPVPRVVLPFEVRVVKAPVPGVPEPMAPGAAKVAPFKEEALRLATLVVEAMVNGAVPVDTVEVMTPEAERVVTPLTAPVVPTVKAEELMEKVSSLELPMAIVLAATPVPI